MNLDLETMTPATFNYILEILDEITNCTNGINLNALMHEIPLGMLRVDV